MKKISYELFFKALSNRTRLAIVESLRGGPKNVGAICKKVRLEQSLVSHNLRILEAWGLVHSEREGKTVVYSLDGEHLVPVLAHIDGYMRRYERKLCTCGILKGGKKCPHLKEGR